MTAFFGSWRRVSLTSDWPVISWIVDSPPLLAAALAAGAFILGGALVAWHYERRAELSRHPAAARGAAALLLALAALVALAFLSAPQALAPTVAGAGAWRLALVLALGALAWLARPSPGEVTAALAIGLAVQAPIGIAQFLAQRSLGLGALGEIQGLDSFTSRASVVSAGDEHWLRAYGLAAHPNVLGGYLVLGLLMLCGALVAGRGGRLRGLLWALTIAGLVALVLTFSRSAWVGLAAGLVALAWAAAGQLRGRLGRRGLLAAVLVVALVGLSVREALLARALVSASALEEQSIAERLFYAAAAWKLIVARPWLGYGVDNFPLAVQALLHETPSTLGYPNVHNVLLLAGSELGSGAALIWLGLGALGVLVPFQLVRAGRARGRQVDPRVVALGAAWLALWVIGLFDYYLWSSLRNSMVWPVVLGAWIAWWPQLLRPAAPQAGAPQAGAPQP
jgi:hypothetical protein